MLAALLVTLVQATSNCSACTTSGKDVRLCSPHAEEERAAFARAGKRLGSKDAGERAAGLAELARVTGAHVNAPSRRVAERLVSALDDESTTVRTRAAELLGAPQNALVALDGLLDAFRSTEVEREQLVKELAKLRAKQGGSPRPRESTLAELKRDQEACKRESDALMQWRTALLAQLALFPDDRVVEALLHAPRGMTLGCNEALVQLGSRSALKGVVESFRVWEEELADMQKAFDQVMAALSGDEAMADALRDSFREELDKKRAEGTAYQPEIIRLVGELGRGPAPEAGDHPFDAWQRWFLTHVDALPEHLPGVSSPAW